MLVLLEMGWTKIVLALLDIGRINRLSTLQKSSVVRLHYFTSVFNYLNFLMAHTLI